MGVSRKSRPSETTLDSIFRSVRTLDVLLNLGEAHRLSDVRDEVYCIKWQLDKMVEQFAQEFPSPPPVTTDPSPHGPTD
jgi:hypothetical protein